MIEVLKARARTIHLRPNPLEGCIRRNKLDETERGWRWLRSVALLDRLADREQVHLPTGEVYDIHIARTEHGDCGVLFRGGREKPWWRDDAELQAACLVTFASQNVQGMVILQELDSDLLWHYFANPAAPTQLATTAFKGLHAEPPSRLDKSSARAHASCRYCPVKWDCDRLDLQYGHTRDWDETT